MKALVTGADGFIGSHLVERLLADGKEVRAFCFYNSNSSYGWLDSLPANVLSEIEIVLGDIRDPNGVKNAMIGCTDVYHLAALIGIPYSYTAPSSYIDTNINGTLNIVQAAREIDIQRVIVTSTSETYGTAQFVPITEEHPQVGQSPYAASKIGADQLALSYWRSFGTRITVLRPFNTYGPRQSARAVIPTIITQIASGKKEIELGAVSPTRDFNFVEDICEAFIRAANSELTIGEIVNAASNFEISIGDTADMIKDIMGVDVEVITNETRTRPVASEVNRLFGDNSKMMKLTSWKPKYSGMNGFRRGLSKTIEWFTDPRNLSHYKPGIYLI